MCSWRWRKNWQKSLIVFYVSFSFYHLWAVTGLVSTKPPMCCAKACYKRPKKTTSCGGRRFGKNQIRGLGSPEGVQPSPASHSFPKSLNGVVTEGKTDVTGKEMAKKKSIIQQGMNSFRSGRDPLAESGRYREARCSRSGKQRWRDRR